MPARLSNVRIEHPKDRWGGHSVVYGTLECCGKEVQVFSYYRDEIGFRPDEINGLTLDEARALHQKKDVAYLQS